MKNFRSLTVWSKSHQLTLSVYKVSQSYPKGEEYGLKSQIRRATSSIPTNIAEGCGRGSDKDFARFLQIAMGSASEVEYLLILCHELNYIASSDFESLTDQVQEIKRMLSSLIVKIRNASK